MITLDQHQLKKMGRHLVNRCSFYGENEKTVKHILIGCSKARDLWSFLFALFSIVWVLPCTVREMLIGWQGSLVRKKHKKIWMAAPLCLFWIVWRERNRTIFDDETPSVQRMKSFFCLFSLVLRKAGYRF